MSFLPTAFRRVANLVPGISVVPESAALWWRGAPVFALDGKIYRSFCHAYNCGWPTARMSERAVELAVADSWLDHDDRALLVEIGAVTPYYWPGRVSRIVDPFDSHRRVTDKCSLFDVDFSGMDVVSISTLEHIGLGDYVKPKVAETAQAAFEKISREASRYFVTVPYGVNPAADEFFFSGSLPAARYLVRNPTDNWWHQVASGPEARRPYGRREYAASGWANGLAILLR